MLVYLFPILLIRSLNAILVAQRTIQHLNWHYPVTRFKPSWWWQKNISSILCNSFKQASFCKPYVCIREGEEKHFIKDWTFPAYLEVKNLALLSKILEMSPIITIFLHIKYLSTFEIQKMWDRVIQGSWAREFDLRSQWFEKANWLKDTTDQSIISQKLCISFQLSSILI